MAKSREIAKFWKLEELPSKSPMLSIEETARDKRFVKLWNAMKTPNSKQSYVCGSLQNL